MSPHSYDVVGVSTPASGIVVEEGRGALPFRLIHGESLVATAAWAVGAAGIELLDQTVPWDVVVERAEPLLLHDPLCPMTPPEFLARCVERADVADRVVVGVRPVTDTVKEVTGDVLGATVDRDELVAVCSPVVLPDGVVADLVATDGELPLPSLDFVELVSLLRERYGDDRIDLVEAPPEARRVASDDDIAVLAALTAPR
jgi:2-C-methyl-D-erythritol 4-phosphate cytidylyltransferase